MGWEPAKLPKFATERCTSLEPWTPTSAVRDRATARRERQREQQRPAEHLRANELGRRKVKRMCPLIAPYFKLTTGRGKKTETLSSIVRGGTKGGA